VQIPPGIKVRSVTIKVQHIVKICGTTQSLASREALPPFDETLGGVFLGNGEEGPVVNALLLEGGQQGNTTE